MDSLEVTDQAAAKVAIAPRVKLADIEAAIERRFDVNGYLAIGMPGTEPRHSEVGESLSILSLCILVMKNGFTVVGKSAPASRENFDARLGAVFAYEDCIRQLWPLMGYALRDLIHAEKKSDDGG